MQKLSWYWHKLWAMTREEIGYWILWRLKRTLWKNLKIPSPSQPDLEKIDRSECDWVEREKLSKDKLEQLLAENKRCRGGQHTFLNIETKESPLKWHVDPQSGIEALRNFAPETKYQKPGVAGNVRNTWEKNRHHFLVSQAIEGSYCQQENSRKYIVDQLKNWVAKNPFPYGINYVSSLELGIRLINWIYIERFLRGYREHQELFGDGGIMWDPIYHHQNIIYNHPAVGSAANSRLVGEMAGLYCASLVWPVFPETEEWRNFSRARLKETIEQQLFPGGLQREQAIDYHLFCMECYLIAYLETMRAGGSLGSEYTAGLSRMYEALFFFMRKDGKLFKFGDSDDSGVIKLFSDHCEQLDYIISLGEEFLEITSPVVPEPAISAVVLKGGLSFDLREDRAVNEETSTKTMEDAGWYILEECFDSGDEISCLFDAGPLGYSPFATHGHADVLSFQLTLNGKPVFVDPGTYTYHYRPGWREYFRGTRAHNTVVVDGKNQASPGGLFLWKKHYEAKVQESPRGENKAVEGLHDGYKRFLGSPVHSRRFELSDAKVTVVDKITGKGKHSLEIRFHFAPDVETRLAGTNCVLKAGGDIIMMNLPIGFQWDIRRADAEAGWFSSAFNCREPSDTLRGQTRVKLPFKSKTEIRFLG